MTAAVAGAMPPNSVHNPPTEIMEQMLSSMSINLDQSSARQLLREDDSLLRQVFFNVLRQHHPGLATKVDVVYALSQAWVSGATDKEFSMLQKYLEDLQPEETILVASAFSHMLNLHNLTEDVINTQTERAARISEVQGATRSTNRSIIKLTKQNHINPTSIYEALCKQTVELVMTAHPTQAFRQSLLKKYAKVRQVMGDLHTKRMSQYEKKELLEAIRGQVEAAWRTDEIRRQKPTPQDEMRHGLSYFTTTLVNVIPVFYRRIDSALANIGQPKLPLEHTLFKFGSWMGGDRDGNPNVTAETTRDVCVLARLEAVNSFFIAIEGLMFELSMWRCSPELKAFATKIAVEESRDAIRIADERKRRNYAEFWTPIPVTEPFRVVLSHIRDRLWATREVLHKCLINPQLSVRMALEEADGYQDGSQIFQPLKLMYDSLESTGDRSIANARLLDVLRQVRTFGLGMMRLDIRQESSRHTEAVDAVTQFLGLGSYAEWSEEQRQQFLVKELQGKRPLIPPGVPMSEDVEEVFKTFRILAELPGNSLGAYVISMARTASDVLSVVLLQREFGIQKYLRVVPLFETLDDLNNAPKTIHTLLSNDWYREHIQGVQECMIGYSDSGKDAGRLAASWALFETQEKIVAVAEEFGVDMPLFHGRGGTVGRGGGPTHVAIRSQPPGTIKGALRVTIQGETIEQQFGEMEIAFRTLDLYTSAVLEARMELPPPPPQEWRDMMNQMSKTSCEKYRSYVFKNPLFLEYFHSATPVAELGRLNIGSRPSSRAKKAGVQGLRAIPWVFAWTQTRLHLPVWLGMGDAILEVIDQGKLSVLQDMYAHWPFFKGMMDLIEMVLAKADPRVTAMYDRKLVGKELQNLGDELRQKYAETKDAVLKLVGKDQLLEKLTLQEAASAELEEKIRLRTPYVTPLNILQVLALYKLRDFDHIETEEVKGYKPADQETLELLQRDHTKDLTKQHPYQAAMDDCLLITIKGIAAGMQNTG